MTRARTETEVNDIKTLLNLLQIKNRRKLHNQLNEYAPYPKQIEFHNLGSRFTERCFMAGNQLGKSLSGSREAAYHATGLYPSWWQGRRFNEATKGWACGETGEVVRDSIQLLLLGDISKEGDEGLGSGAIPKDRIIKYSRAMGTSNLVDCVHVRHVSGSTSQIFLKAYSKGREKFQASTIHWIWFDEEPPQEIYTEGLTRTNKYGQFSFMTYTPLLGMSMITHKFYNEPGKNQVLVSMTIHDVEHYTAEEIERIIESYPAHERDARAKGIPVLGSGRVFLIDEEKIMEDPITIHKHFVQINGLDFGWDHPQACVNLAWDRDHDILHVTKTFRERECTPINAAFTIGKWGSWIPTAWPHDGYQHDKGSGDELASLYRDAGLNMLEEHATHEAGGYGVEAGIMEMTERMQTGRFKVNRFLSEWFEEYRMYHREDGLIIKERDDLMAATRYGVMMRRFASVMKTNKQGYRPKR